MTIIEKAKNLLFCDKNKAYTFFFAGLSLLVAGFLKLVGFLNFFRFLGIGGTFLIIGLALAIIGLVHAGMDGWDGRFKRDRI